VPAHPLIASGAALSQPVLDLQAGADDLAFQREAVEAVAEQPAAAMLGTADAVFTEPAAGP